MKNFLLLTLGISFFLVSCSEGADGSDSSGSVEAGFSLRPSGGGEAEEEEADSPIEDEVSDTLGRTGGHHHHSQNHANQLLEQTEIQDLIAHYESPDRVLWQKPDELLKQLGDIENKVVMDLGAGSGYFAFRLQEAGAHVIAAEVDDRLIGFLQGKRDSMEISPVEFDVRKVFFDDPLVAKDELDLFFTVDTYHHIDRREDYLKKVYHGVKPGGKMVIVDFKNKTTPHGPPVNIRLHHTIAQREIAAAGFSNITVDTVSLPEQYILIAEKSN